MVETLRFGDKISAMGDIVGDPIAVRLSNEIVTLLSSQLYQSPLKAIEELVVNAYDADAGECRVYVPDKIEDSSAIVVFDDGVGMDREGLSDLWHIAKSKKRSEDYRRTERKQIGKFGIGKLATYAVADRITYLSRREDVILAVTADFRKFDQDVPVHLPVTRVDPWSELEGSKDLGTLCGSAGLPPASLFGAGLTTWTIVILEKLKSEFHFGRLKWVLSTAMPLCADFKLYLNGQEVESSKAKTAAFVQFDVTALPERRLLSAGKATGENWRIDAGRLSTESFPSGVTGTVLVAEHSLHTGKSADLQRSHGFFVRVRGRLVNETDPLFGLSPLSYQTFNRFHADLFIDDLDAVVAAPREGIVESSLKQKVLPLLSEIFYEARDRYENHQTRKDEEEKRKREHERGYVPERLVEYPLADVLSVPSRGTVDGAEPDDTWFFLDVTDDTDMSALVRGLYGARRDRKYRYRYSGHGSSKRIVKFNPKDHPTFDVNADHDLVLAYYEDPRARRLLEDVITAEVMLEVYLRQCGVPGHVVGQVLERRDSLMRGLANEEAFSLGLISQSLIDGASDEHDLEVALIAAVRALGFVAKHMGGAGEPDGIGRFTGYPREEYTITLEAKSSQRTPTLAHLDFAGIEEHMRSYGAAGCLLVAPRYPGSDNEHSAVAERSRSGRISCWTVDQLSRVTRAAEDREIGTQKVLDIVLHKHAPEEVTEAVSVLLESPSYDRPRLYRSILKALGDLSGRLVDQARTVSHVAAEVTRNEEFRDLAEEDIGRAVEELAGASKGGIRVRGQRIVMLTSVEEIQRRLAFMTQDGGHGRRGGSFRD